MNDATLLLVEDDPDISTPMANYLINNGYRVVACESAESAQQWLKSHKADLILLDIMLPGESGLDLCRRLRGGYCPPIIMVTALDDPIDNVVGLELGADDYVAKPFDLSVLLARIRAVLRRVNGAEQAAVKTGGEHVIHFANCTFYPLRRYLHGPTGIRKSLTAGETDLLLVLCQNGKKVLSREDLIDLMRGENGSAASMRSVDLLISRLRRKLVFDDMKEELIQTFRNNGYLFRPEVRGL